MELTKIPSKMPIFLKLKLKPFYNKIYKKITKTRTINEIHDYWKLPNDGYNCPENYLRAELKRSQFLAELIEKYNSKNIKILEIGCNVGRNLNYLYSKGFRNLNAIEINANAIQLLKKSYPEMAENVNIYNVPIEEAIKKFKDNEFDVIFTMAVLQHISPRSEWIFSEMFRITNSYIITIEDEFEISWRHFPRNYNVIFKSLNMKQIEHKSNLTKEGLNHNFVMNVFKKDSSRN